MVYLLSSNNVEKLQYQQHSPVKNKKKGILEEPLTHSAGLTFGRDPYGYTRENQSS